MNFYRYSELKEFYQSLEHVFQETSLNVLSTADLLRERLAFFTGGTLKNSPILTFPDNPQIELTQEKYKKLVSYLTQVPSENERQLGFVLIIDRRSDRWMAVKSVMGFIEEYFPYTIRCIYLLRPNSWVQRALSRITILNEITCSYPLIVCRTLAELHEHFDASQLSKDLGGTIDFRLFEWIERRAAIEKLTQSIHELSEMLLVFIKQCDEVEFPNAVQSTQQLLAQHATQKNELTQELQRIKTWGQSLLAIIRQHAQYQETTETSIDSSDPNQQHQNQLVLSADQAAHARACANALIHVEENESVLSQFWSLHQARLNRCLALRHFEERFKDFQSQFIQLYDEILDLPDWNKSLALVESTRFDCQNQTTNREQIDQTLIQVDNLSQRAQIMISHASLLARDGLDLIVEHQKEQSTTYGIDSIEPKCHELEEMKKNLCESLDEKRQNLKLLRTYVDKLEAINLWCTRGKDMLAMHPIHLSTEKAARSLDELENFLSDLSPINLHELQQAITPEPLRSMIMQVFNRVDDVRDLCEKRCEQLRRLAVPVHRPVQRVHPLSVFEQNESLNLIGTTNTNLLHLPINDFDSTLSSSSSSSSSNHQQNSSNDPDAIRVHYAKMDKKQKHVVTELLMTEQVYVDELRTVIEGYMLKFDEPERYRYLPPAILQNRAILFSNLPDIYAFHATSFLRDLQQIRDDSNASNPCSIGSAIASSFIKRKTNFKLYEQYVLNKSQSERVWEQFCSGHPFFTKIQQSLGHRLPLDSYLLKPIQRITQYQLLLKEMIKYTRDDDGRAHLEEALRVMLNILSNLNDVMHSTQIVGFPEPLNSLGRIRLRAENCLISKEKRRGTVYTRTKTSTRDIFLFERDLLLCKKKEEANSKTVQYQFKEMIKVVDIAVCTHPKNDRNKFELVLKDWSFIIQLTNPCSSAEKIEDLSSKWIDTIKNCVTQQTEQRRAEMKQRSASLDHSSFAHRRQLQHRTTMTIHSPDSDDNDDESGSTQGIIDLHHDQIKRTSKLPMNNHIARL